MCPQPQRSKILIVDDEVDILVALTDLFEAEFDVFTASDPTDALKLLKQHADIAVIISDQRMPLMTGDVFLTRAREISDAFAMLLTGYADLAVVIAALNQGRIKFYAPKPWQSDALLAMVREMANHCQLQRALQTERALLHGILDLAQVEIVFSDADGRVLRHNLRRPEGVTRNDLAEEDLSTPEERACVPLMRAATIENGHDERLARVHGDGAWRWKETSRALLAWPRRSDGALAPKARRWHVAIARDVTERLRLESRVRQDDKMRALGTLSGGIAHDFNNLLTAILGSLELLEEVLPREQQAAHKLVRNAIDSAHRGTSLTRGLLEFGRPKSTSLRPVSLAPLVLKMRDLLVQSLNRSTATDPQGHACQLDLSAIEHVGPLPRVHSDPNQLEMALLNLCINARDAMPDGGTVSLHLDEETSVDGRKFVVLSVSDQGCGMSPEVAARIFEPFFTTKRFGKGTGLGLSTIYSFLRHCDGDIRVESKPGEGTRMALLLPVCSGAESNGETSRSSCIDFVPPLKILLADDEDDVREITEQLLQRDGHRVVAVSDGLEALNRLEVESDFDLVLLDFLMPKMGGVECGKTLHERWPHLPILYVSGYAHPESLPADALILGKPYTPCSLRQMVRYAMQQNAHEETQLAGGLE